MNKILRIDLFVEDIAHENLLRSLIARIAQEEDYAALCQVRSARGGRPQVFREFKLYHQHLRRNVLDIPDLFVVAIDSNCSTFIKVKKEIEEITDENYQHLLVCACPDPHIERWYMADPNSFYSVVGYRPAVGAKKCERNYYKQLLRKAILEGGNPATFSGIEFASELAGAMDLFQAERVDASLKAFLGDLRNKLRA